MTLPWTEAPISSARLPKAWQCVVRQYARGEYLVYSPSGERYVVQTRSVTMPLCECAAHAFREDLCVHAVAVLLHERRPHVLQAVTDWLAERPSTANPATEHPVLVASRSHVSE
jgi:hypothetical protein